MASKNSKREEVELEEPTDQWGNVPERDKDRYPKDSPAAKGKATLPSGQGGSSPHDGVSLQDQFPPNPEPSESAKEWGEKIDEVGPVQAHSDAIAEASGGKIKQSGSDPKTKAESR